MIIFNSDLDNTLIYSYKRDIGSDKRCVELYNDREVSFMTEKSVLLLKEVNSKLLFVPTTTRTTEQYKRITLDIGQPKYALVCNGGILLEDGVVSKSWYEDSLEMISESRGELENGIALLEKDVNRNFEVRFIDDLFVFTKSEAPEKTIAYLKTFLNFELVDVFSNGTKVYIVPKNMTKGNAINRLKELLHPQKIIAAGDSEFDISMLQIADRAYAPKELADQISMQKEKLMVNENKEVFSDFILNDLLGEI